MNKFYLKLSDVNQGLQLPVEVNWDFLGKQDSIEDYESTVIDEIIGTATDFEVSRFYHDEYNPPNDNRTSVHYDFRFYSSGVTSVSSTTVASTNLWVNSYLAEGFSSTEVYYFSRPFRNSFFKLDFYDSNDVKSQTNYFTVIIPTQQGLTQSASTSSVLSNVNIKKPYFILDFIGDQEGFFFYWLTDFDYLQIDTFYMSAKFFDAKSGIYIKMMNRKQTQIGGTNYFNFKPENYFYYRVELDYSDYTYKVYDTQTNLNVGGSGNSIKWYEYVNP